MPDDTSSSRTYLAIDLKSFYASVECVERRLDPLTTNLVVADPSRTEKTICLAVSPSLKAQGIPGRPRLFEVVQKVKEINRRRLAAAIHAHAICRKDSEEYAFSSSSFDADALARDPSLELSYLVAPPRMQLYLDYSTRIYEIYLKYISPEDIHVYSVDEVFIDMTSYLKLYRLSAQELAMTLIREVLYSTGITATAGIGSNLYLCKVAMDIVAKHVEPDADGVRLAILNEHSYRRLLWTHTPLTDFWRIGRGTVRRLASVGLYTMGDIARCSTGKSNDYYNEDLLYRLFGVNAELLIDHAWGWEPVTLEHIKAYQPENRSLGQGQVLQRPYSYQSARLIVREMTDLLALNLAEKGLVTDQLVLTIGYDRENLAAGGETSYVGAIRTDHYGRRVPAHAHGSISLEGYSSSSRRIIGKMLELYERIVDPRLLIRRVNVCANHVVPEAGQPEEGTCRQMDLFTDFLLPQQAAAPQKQTDHKKACGSEKELQQAILTIQKKYGKNAILKGMNLLEDGTTRERNLQIGGHKA